MQIKCPWSVILWEATGKVCLVCYGFPQRRREPMDSPVEGMELSSNVFEYFLFYLLLGRCCGGSSPVTFMQNTGVIPGEMSVAPSSPQPANNSFWFCLVLQYFNNSKHTLVSKCVFCKSCQYSKQTYIIFRGEYTKVKHIML